MAVRRRPSSAIYLMCKAGKMMENPEHIHVVKKGFHLRRGPTRRSVGTLSREKETKKKKLTIPAPDELFSVTIFSQISPRIVKWE